MVVVVVVVGVVVGVAAVIVVIGVVVVVAVVVVDVAAVVVVVVVAVDVLVDVAAVVGVVKQAKNKADMCSYYNQFYLDFICSFVPSTDFLCSSKLALIPRRFVTEIFVDVFFTFSFC